MAKKAEKYRDQGLEELEANYHELCKELFKLRNEKQVNKKMEQPHLLRDTKREIARLLTVIREKKLVAANG